MTAAERWIDEHTAVVDDGGDTIHAAVTNTRMVLWAHSAPDEVEIHIQAARAAQRDPRPVSLERPDLRIDGVSERSNGASFDKGHRS